MWHLNFTNCFGGEHFALDLNNGLQTFSSPILSNLSSATVKSINLSLGVVRVFMFGYGVLSFAESMRFFLGGDDGRWYLIFAWNFENKILNIFLNHLIWTSHLLVEGINDPIQRDSVFFHVIYAEVLWSICNVALDLTLFFASFDRR